ADRDVRFARRMARGWAPLRAPHDRCHQRPSDPGSYSLSVTSFCRSPAPAAFAPSDDLLAPAGSIEALRQRGERVVIPFRGALTIVVSGGSPIDRNRPEWDPSTRGEAALYDHPMGVQQFDEFVTDAGDHRFMKDA